MNEPQPSPGQRARLERTFALKQRTNLNKRAAINFFSFPRIMSLNCSYDQSTNNDHSCYQRYHSYSPLLTNGKPRGEATLIRGNAHCSYFPEARGDAVETRRINQ